MCGICGIVLHDPAAAIELDDIHAMCATIVHRGPDEEGTYTQAQVALGMRRLSIIDLSGGSQPIFNEDRSIAVVFNGEIYNYLELRKTLEHAGHVFGTRSDTEVIVHAYEEWGDDCPNHLRGMFLFALHDVKQQRVFIARDRMGKKPLYYYRDGRRIIFASEIKALFALHDVPRRMNLAALDSYLSLGYVPAPQTMFAEIFKLPAASSMSIQAGSVRVQPYWDQDFSTVSRLDYGEARAELKRLLWEAVRVRLMSEVPLGAYLSGGIDSSVIVGIMTDILQKPVETFSVGFERKELNELPYARMAAEAFHSSHHEILLKTCTPELFERMVWHFDEPVADPAAIPTLLLSELARRHVTVVLTGEGGDEMFGGYDHYRLSLGTRSLNILPERLRREVLPAYGRLVNSLRGRPIYHARTIWHWSMPFSTNMGAWVALFTEEDKKHMYLPGVFDNRSQHSGFEAFQHYYFQAKDIDLLRRMMYIDTKVWLADDLLMKVDKMAMAHSIEARAPYLDHHLYTFAASLPSSYKIHNGTSKRILKEVACEILPAEIVNRPKHTFDVPIDEWLTGSLSELARQFVADGCVAGMRLFDSKYLMQTLWSQLERREPGVDSKLWALLALGVWAEKYQVSVG